MSSVTVQEAILAALKGRSSITALLGTFKGNPSIHTRRPAPDGAEHPMSLISRPTGQFDQDGLTSFRPVEMRQVSFYGRQPDDVRAVDEAARLAQLFFHRNKSALSITGVKVLDIVARGPFDAPSEDVTLTGTMISLTIRMERTA